MSQVITVRDIMRKKNGIGSVTLGNHLNKRESKIVDYPNTTFKRSEWFHVLVNICYYATLTNTTY